MSYFCFTFTRIQIIVLARINFLLWLEILPVPVSTQWQTGTRQIFTHAPVCEQAVHLPSLTQPLQFNLDKSDIECEIALIGSQAENCTAEVSCNELNLPSRNSDGICNKGHIIIVDSFGSQIIGCGKMEFGKPYRPSRNGRDLYIKIKGISTGTTCYAYCGEQSAVKLNFKQQYQLLTTHPKYSGRHVTKQCSCGHQKFDSSALDARIVNGVDAKPFEFGWVAVIVRRGATKNICGASLINDRYVLTAAHCVSHNARNPELFQVLLHVHLLDLLVAFGNVNLEGQNNSTVNNASANLPMATDKDENRIRLNVSRILVHPIYFNYGYPTNDIALLRLEHQVKLYQNDNNGISTICIPKVGQVKTQTGNNLTVVGWGLSSSNATFGHRILQKMVVPIITQKLCQDTLEKAIVDEENPFTYAMFCAGLADRVINICNGDSGSPAFIKLNELQYMQYGIVSWGVQCGETNIPGVYTKIDELIEWIHKETHDAVWCD